MTLAYYGKSNRRRMALLALAMLAILFAAVGGLALTSALAGTPTSGDKSDVKGASFSSGPTLSQTSQMVCDGSTASSFTSAVSFTLSAATQPGAFFIFYLDPNGGSDGDPSLVHQNEVKVYIDGSTNGTGAGLPAGAHTIPFTFPVTVPFTTTKGGILIVFSDDVSGTTWTAKSNSLNCTEATNPTITIDKHAHNGVSTVTAGSSFSYDIVVHNTGTAAASNVVVSDTFSGGGTGTLGTVSGGGCSSLPCTIPSLSAGASVTINVVVNTTAGVCATIDNSATAQITSPAESVTDNTGNQVSVSGCLPTISKARTETSVSGGLGHWDITITNTQTGAVDQNIAISDSGATLVSITGGTGDTCGSVPDADGSFSCTVKAGHTLVLHVTKPVSAASNNTNTCLPGTLDNNSGVTAQIVGGASITISFGSTSIAVPATASANCMTIKKDFTAGSYVITLTNSGPAATVVVTDTFNANGTGEQLGTPAVSPSGTCSLANLTGSGCSLSIGTGTTTITIPVATAGSNDTCSPIDTTNTVAAAIGTANGTTIPTASGGSLSAHNTYPRTREDCANGDLVIKKVKDTSSGVPAADGSLFNGTIDGSVSWGSAITFGGSTGTISLPATTHTVVETQTQNGWTPVGWALGSSDGVCPTDKASYTGGDTGSATVVTGQTTTICVMNTKQPVVDVDPPTVLKTVDGTGLAGDGRLHWLIEINNNHANPADQVVVVTDAGAQLDSVTPNGDAADCGSTPAASPFVCSVLKKHDILLHVSKPIPTMTTLQQCQGVDFTNSASATYGAVAPFTINVDNSNTTIHVPGDTSQCPGPQLSKTAGGFSNGTATWTISVANNGAGAVSRTVVITDTAATLVGATPSGCSGTLAAGMTCVIAGGSTLTFNVQATGLTTACSPGSVSNTASATIDGLNIGGSPTGTVSVTVPADSSKCLTPIPVCTVGCNPVIPTPTVVPPTPTVAPPTATPTRVPPTSSPTAVDTVLGEKTPGPTPIAPSTGSGPFGTSSSSTNVLLALFGLLALSGGLATIAFTRQRPRN